MDMVDNKIMSDYQIFLASGRKQAATAQIVRTIFPDSELAKCSASEPGCIFEYRSKAVRYTEKGLPIFKTAQHLDWEEFSIVLDHVRDIVVFNIEKSSDELFN